MMVITREKQMKKLVLQINMKIMMSGFTSGMEFILRT